VDDEDHGLKSSDDDESEEKVPVHALHQKQAVHKTFTPQGSPTGQQQQPFQAAKTQKRAVEEIKVCCCLKLIFKLILYFILCFLLYSVTSFLQCTDCSL
jgi:hypothetical protein